MNVMQISTPSHESCPAFNKESKKAMTTIVERAEPLGATHGVKSLSVWTGLGEHTMYNIYEVPSADDYWAFLNEPELLAWLSFNKVENRVVVGREEVAAILARD